MKKGKSQRGTWLAAETPRRERCVKPSRTSSWFCCAGTSCVTSGRFSHRPAESAPAVSLAVETRLACPARR